MKKNSKPGKENYQALRWRDPAQVVALAEENGRIASELLHSKASAGWWELLEQLGITLLVSREYEHMLLALSACNGKPQISYLSLPHPSGIAVDRKSQQLYVASTRNPNAVYQLTGCRDVISRLDVPSDSPQTETFVPQRVDFYPGCLYLHDLALVNGKLYGAATGHNAIVQLQGQGKFRRKWWPRSVELESGPKFDCNHIQLNSIAAGKSLKDSYFSASSTEVSKRRPGALNYPVDKCGIVLSGASRKPIVSGLTRPHSVRLERGKLWVANSGYGEVGQIRNQRFEVLTKLNGWTRGLVIAKGVLFVGVSRVLPRFSHYAPGVNAQRAQCGIYALEPRTGKVLGKIIWEAGNQIFAIDWLKQGQLPFSAGARAIARERKLFYSFSV